MFSWLLLSSPSGLYLNIYFSVRAVFTILFEILLLCQCYLSSTCNFFLLKKKKGLLGGNMPWITPLEEDRNLLTVSPKEVQGGSCRSPGQNWHVLIRETWVDVGQRQMLKTALKLFYVESNSFNSSLTARIFWKNVYLLKIRSVIKVENFSKWLLNFFFEICLRIHNTNSTA